jgi:two-component system cell cycle response regulator
VTSDPEYSPPAPRGESCLVVIHPPSLRLFGARFPLTGNELSLGRDPSCDVVLEAPDVSRFHARVRREGDHHILEDLGSRNGTFLRGERVQAGALVHGDLLRLASAVVRYLAADDLETSYHVEMRRLADEDTVTGLALRRVFSEALSRELARSRRHGHPLCLALLDLDRFKVVNDRFGHLVGDKVLRELAASVKPLVRPEQLLARVGGDELALLLPDVPLPKASVFAEKIRRLVEESAFGPPDSPVQVTVSIGLTDLRQGDTDPDALLSRADALLYEAKAAGRNRVCS